MELVADARHPGHGDVIGQIGVRTEQPAAVGAIAAGIEMHHLSRRMHAGVGPARADDFNGFVGDFAECGFEAFLHAVAGALTLPAVIRSAVVLETEGDPH